MYGKQIRRIVAGHNATGKSLLTRDAFATSILSYRLAPKPRRDMRTF
jgi:hypothetical protein